MPSTCRGAIGIVAQLERWGGYMFVMVPTKGKPKWERHKFQNGGYTVVGRAAFSPPIS